MVPFVKLWQRFFKIYACPMQPLHLCNGTVQCPAGADRQALHAQVAGFSAWPNLRRAPRAPKTASQLNALMGAYGCALATAHALAQKDSSSPAPGGRRGGTNSPMSTPLFLTAYCCSLPYSGAARVRGNPYGPVCPYRPHNWQKPDADPLPPAVRATRQFLLNCVRGLFHNQHQTAYFRICRRALHVHTIPARPRTAASSPASAPSGALRIIPAMAIYPPALPRPHAAHMGGGSQHKQGRAAGP